MNWGRHLLTQLDRHPSWATLGWETRGMALALMTRLAGAEGSEIPAWWNDKPDTHAAHRGTLPNRPDTWRSVLGLPSRHMLQGALARTVAGRGSRTEILALDAAWTDAWLPELMNWFRVIDDSFLKDHPEYVSEAGRVWHPMLDSVSEISEGEMGAPRAIDTDQDKISQAQLKEIENQKVSHAWGAKNNPPKISQATDSQVVDAGLTGEQNQKKEHTTEEASQMENNALAKSKTAGGRKKNLDILAAGTTEAKTVFSATKKTRKKKTTAKIVSSDPIQLFWDVAPWRPTVHTLERSWDPPLPGAAQARLWDDGASYLSDGTKESAGKVRSIVGKLIKDYGEQAVAQGLAVVMTRTARPADPVAFLRKTVHAAVNGTPAEERARAQRAKVPL